MSATQAASVASPAKANSATNSQNTQIQKQDQSFITNAIKKPDFNPKKFQIKTAKSLLSLQVILQFELYFVYFYCVYLILVTVLKGKPLLKALFIV